MQGQPDTIGCFSADGASYTLRTPRAPDDWFNVHFSTRAHNHYYTLVSQLGQGTCYARAAEGRHCTFTQGLLKTVYLRDAEDGELWSPTGHPVHSNIADFACVYTLHDTGITSLYRDIRVRLRYFVPPQAMYEIWTVELENTGRTPRRIEVMPFVPIALGGFPRSSVRHQECRFHERINGQFARSTSPFKPCELYNAFLVSSHPVLASRGNHMSILHGIHTAARPDLPARFDPPHQPGVCYALCLFLQNEAALDPGATARLDYALGTAESVEALEPVRALVADAERVDSAWGRAREEYRSLTAGIRVDTGESRRDAIMNLWIKKQMRSYLSFKNAYRDNLQIDMAYSMVSPAEAVENAVDLLGFQYLDGHVPHTCRPLNPVHYSDKPAWLLMTFPELVKETGDTSILERTRPYLNADGKPTRDEKPVWEHLVRTMRHLELDVGPHGINTMHHADWNDGLDSLSGAGESTMTSLLFCAGLREFAGLARHIGEDRVAAEAEDIYARLAARINTVCWDGAWYNRGFAPDGRSIGSRANREGQLFLNPQTWAVISGVADPRRAAAIMEQVDLHLEDELGMNLVWPRFSAYDPDVGSMSANHPGIAENGVYIHAGGFKLVADCLAGRPEQAWRLLHKILPDHPGNPVGRSRCTPFAVTNSWRGAEGECHGLTGSQWRTGSAGWVFRAMVEFILGVRRSYEGLVLDPCLPASQREARVVRVFRGATYRISLDNRAGRCLHARTVTFDGRDLDGNLLPVGPVESAFEVKVTI